MSQGACRSNQANLSQWRHSGDTDRDAETGGRSMYWERCVNTGESLAAPQGFEPRYADPEFVVAH